MLEHFPGESSPGRRPRISQVVGPPSPSGLNSARRSARWEGARTELSSGVIQMGARSYQVHSEGNRKGRYRSRDGRLHTIAKEIEEQAATLEFEGRTIEDAEKAMEKFELRYDPFRVPNFSERILCLEQGVPAIFEVIATDGGSAAQEAEYFATGCTEGVAEQ